MPYVAFLSTARLFNKLSVNTSWSQSSGLSLPCKIFQADTQSIHRNESNCERRAFMMQQMLTTELLKSACIFQQTKAKQMKNTVLSLFSLIIRLSTGRTPWAIGATSRLGLQKWRPHHGTATNPATAYTPIRPSYDSLISFLIHEAGVCHRDVAWKERTMVCTCNMHNII